MTQTTTDIDVTSSPLAGRIALVTGGSRGIGAGVVRRLTTDGAAVAFTYRESEDRALDLEQEIINTGGMALAIQAESADPEAIRLAVAKTVGQFGGLDVLVNNAGTSHMSPIEDFPMNEYDRLLAVNVRAVFVAIQAAVPHLSDGGRIITIGSVLADRAPISGISVYALTKAAVAGLTRNLARELGPRGITVNTIQPGPIATDMNPEVSDFADAVRSVTAVGHYGQPHDIADAVAFLARAETRFITGTSWNIDGGYAL